MPEPKISIMRSTRDPREQWIRFTAPNMGVGAITNSILVNTQHVGHRWMREVADDPKGKMYKAHVSGGAAVSCSLTLRHTNERIPELTEPILRTMVEMALEMAAENPQSVPLGGLSSRTV